MSRIHAVQSREKQGVTTRCGIEGAKMKEATIWYSEVTCKDCESIIARGLMLNG